MNDKVLTAASSLGRGALVMPAQIVISQALLGDDSGLVGATDLGSSTWASR